MASVSEARALINTVKESIRAEDREKVARISDAYYETVCENFELKEKNAELLKEIDKLREQLKAKSKLISHGAAYFVAQDGEEIGAVCPRCYKADETIVLLEASEHGARCPQCKGRYAGVKASIQGRKQKLV